MADQKDLATETNSSAITDHVTKETTSSFGQASKPWTEKTVEGITLYMERTQQYEQRGEVHSLSTVCDCILVM